MNSQVEAKFDDLNTRFLVISQFRKTKKNITQSFLGEDNTERLTIYIIEYFWNGIDAL